MKINLKTFVLLALLATATLPFRAQGATATGEQLLSRTGTNPTVAVDGHGGFVLGWQDVDVPHSPGIFAATLPQGAQAPRQPFRVNTTTAGDQTAPDVAADPGGRFVFVWQDEAQVVGQAFGAGGGRQSPEIDLSSTGAGVLPQVAMADGGDFLAAWVGSRSSRPAIEAALFTAGGTRQGAEIDLNARGLEDNLIGVASVLGGYAVGWTEIYDCHFDQPGGFVGVVARFDASGRRLGPAFRVGSPTCNAAGGSVFALVGSKAGTLALFFNGPGLLAQRFAATGEPTAQFRVPVPPCTEGHCVIPTALTMDDSGRFAMIWENDDLNRLSLSVQLFNPRGKPLTGRIAVSDDVSGSFETPAAALADDGTLAVVWRREVGSVNATDGLFVRRLALGGKAGV
jgi:hypothetical protein